MKYEWRATCHICGATNLVLTSDHKMVDHRDRRKAKPDWCKGGGKEPQTITKRKV